MWNHLLHPALSWMENTIPQGSVDTIITFGNTFGLDILAMGALHASGPRFPMFYWVIKALSESALCAPTQGGYRQQCVDTEL
eukprot:327111-Karenia_brevis.AAC.1